MDLFKTKPLQKLLADAADPLAAEGHGPGLKRTLGAFNLTALGIGLIISAGIFS